MQSARTIGNRGERLAQAYLRRQGYDIVAANWSSIEGELDIVARQDDMLVFVEVRTRRDSNTEAALASITPRKRQRMINAVYRYLSDQELDPDSDWRIDVIAIALQRNGSRRIAHVEDAFDW